MHNFYMRLFLLFLFSLVQVKAVTTSQSPQWKRHLTAVYGLILFQEQESQWNKCYVTKDNKISMEQCSGTCVIKFRHKLDPAHPENNNNSTTYWCQELDTYPLSNKHVCTNTDVQYPNVRIYYDRNKHVKVHLYCCQGDLCNAPGKYFPIESHYMVQTENMEMDHYDISLIVTSYLLLIVLTISPIYYWRKNVAEDERLMMSLDDQPEKAVVLMQNRQKMKYMQVAKPTTGQFSFHDLCRRFAEMELHTVKRKPPKPFTPSPTIRHYLLKADGYGHRLVKARRETLVRYENMLWTIIEHGPYAFNWKPIDLVEQFDQAKEIFEAEPPLLHLALPLAIIGDIRGQYTDLLRWLSLVGLPPRRKLLFLGGLIDPNEPGSLDCLALVSAMKILYPNDVFVLRGVPESMPIRFGPRHGARDMNTIQSAASRLCHHLPIAARIHKCILAVHSGISHQLSNPKCFDLVNRPFGLDDMPQLARELIFNQPTTAIKMYRSDPNSNSDFFGFTAVTRLCREMNLKFIIRSRNPLPEGIMWNVRGKMVSIWSAPGKWTKTGTMGKGSILLLDACGNANVFSIAAMSKEEEEEKLRKILKKQ